MRTYPLSWSLSVAVCLLPAGTARAEPNVQDTRLLSQPAVSQCLMAQDWSPLRICRVILLLLCGSVCARTVKCVL